MPGPGPWCGLLVVVVIVVVAAVVPVHAIIVALGAVGRAGGIQPVWVEGGGGGGGGAGGGTSALRLSGAPGPAEH